MGSTYSTIWRGWTYPDFVAEGSGDQKAIMGAICGVKQGSFDGVDCVGGDDAATGTVRRVWTENLGYKRYSRMSVCLPRVSHCCKNANYRAPLLLLMMVTGDATRWPVVRRRQHLH